LTLGEILVFYPAEGGGLPARQDRPLQRFRADRGSRKGQEVLVWATDARTRSQEPTGVDGGGQAEYHLLSPEKVGALPSVEVLGMHYAKVRPDRREAFERFVGERLHPAVANLRPDLRILYYRAVRGGGASNYVALFALTKASRDKYWPGGSDSDDLRAAFKPLQPLAGELRPYLVEGSFLDDPKFAAAVYESRDWTDFVLVSSSSPR
jgi:hypothetical protein